MRLAWIGIPAAALLVGVAWAAPHLPPSVLLPTSLAWLVTLAVVLGTAIRLAARRWGRVIAAALLIGGVGVPVVLTAVPWSGRLGTAMPCRRDWGWLPSYFLRSSPTRSIRFRVGDTRVKVCYGAPRSRGRHMIGGPGVPYGRLWRTGANEPTTFRSDGPLTVAGIRAPAGRFSLYTVPGPETWEIILNRSTEQWGIETEYSESIRNRELGRAVVRSERSATWSEALTLSAEPDPLGGIDLVIHWEDVRVRLRVAAPRS